MIAEGKGFYLWNTLKIIKEQYSGHPQALVDDIKSTGARIVALKIQDGALVWGGLQPVIDLFREAGFSVGAWGYSYLNGAWWAPRQEAEAVIRGIKLYKPDFFLIDAEAQAKFQTIAATAFAGYINGHRSEIPSVPFGLNSYYLPQYHWSLPWAQLGKCVDFVCPQFYWRTNDPISRLQMCKEGYQKYLPHIPMKMIAGDLYEEYGVKPTPGSVTLFLKTVKADPTIGGAIMWVWDSISRVPALRAAFTAFSWPVSEDPPTPPPPEPEKSLGEQLLETLREAQNAPSLSKTKELVGLGIDTLIRLLETISDGQEPEPHPIYVAAVNVAEGSTLNVRPAPNTSYSNTPVDRLRRGERVEVWEQVTSDGRQWAKISNTQARWVAESFLTKL